MRRRRRRRPSDLESSINIIPMGDVAFCLLLGFLVVTPVILETLQATLPQGGGAASGQVKHVPVVILNTEGRISIDGKQCTLDELPAKVRELFPAGVQMERKVMLTAAGEIPYQQVVDLMDLLKENGVETFGVR